MMLICKYEMNFQMTVYLFLLEKKPYGIKMSLFTLCSRIY